MSRRSAWLLAAALAGASCIGDSPIPKAGDPPSDEAQVCTTEVGARLLRRLTAWEMERTLRDIFTLSEEEWGGTRLGADPLSKHGFTNDADLLLVGSQSAEDILATAEELAQLVVQSDKLTTLLPCAGTALDDACVEQFVAIYGRRLYRRPLSAEERLEYQTLYAKIRDQADANTGLKWMLVALIQSPQAVYRAELGVMAGEHYDLTQHELATEIAYTFSGTTPSAALLDKADQGKLDSEEAVIAEARALSATPRGRETVHRLLQEWSGYATIHGKAKDVVDNFDVISELMAEETRRFLDDVVIENEGGVAELLTAPHTFVDGTLADFYGFSVTGSAFQQIDRPANWGVGLLAQGSLLGAYAHMGSSSPTLRGLFVLRRLLCQETEAPDNVELAPLPAQAPGETTTRERYESVHTASAQCSYCHNRFDPMGFALEHFDETGRYRETEHGLEIDDSGHVSFAGAEPAPIQGPVQFAETLAASEQTSACISDLFARYTYGSAPCMNGPMADARRGLSERDYGLTEYLIQLATTPHFYRRMP